MQKLLRTPGAAFQKGKKMKRITRIIAAALLAALMVSILSSVAAFADNKYYPGQILTFGTYEQDDNYGNGLEPLEWIVLSSDGKETMMITRYAVDCKPFNELPCKVRWAGSSLRRWLNNEFYNTAFSSSEHQTKLWELMMRS